MVGRQAIDRVALPTPALGLLAGQAAADLGAHPPKVSGVGPQGADGGAGPPRRFGSGRLGSRATYQGARPPVVSVVGTQSPDLGAGQLDFRWVGAAYPAFTVQGLRG